MLANHSPHYDRFIPQHTHTHTYLNLSPFPSPSPSPFPQTSYTHLIKKRLFQNHNSKLIGCGGREGEANQFRAQSSSAYFEGINSNVQSPVKVLEIPKYRDDFYLNNLSWSWRGPLAIALQNQIFLYTPQNLLEIGKTPFGSYASGLTTYDSIIAVGLSNGMIQIYDMERCSLVRTLKNHEGRVSAFTFVDELLVSGSKDKNILVHDLRLHSNQVRRFDGHKGQICALKAKTNGQTVFASGSTDGSAIVWDINCGKINQFKGHKGAVKALDWCPWRSGILATGGGSSTEKSIKIWSTSAEKMVGCQAIEDQISSLVWNEQLRMLATSHGYNRNDLAFWTLQSSHNNGCKIVKQKSFKAHDRRILNMAQSPDGNYLCTVGGDQNLKFWCLRESEENPFLRREASKEDGFRI